MLDRGRRVEERGLWSQAAFSTKHPDSETGLKQIAQLECS